MKTLPCHMMLSQLCEQCNIKCDGEGTRWFLPASILDTHEIIFNDDENGFAEVTIRRKRG